MRRLLLLFIAALLSATPALEAQTMPTRVVRRGGGAGYELSDGEPISYLIEHSRLLELSEEQKTALMELRRMLRASTAPFMKQIDSVREQLGFSLEGRRRPADEEAKARDRLTQLTQPFVDSVKVRNDAARLQARGILDERQRIKLDSLVLSERGAPEGRGGRSGRPPGD